MTHFAGKLPRNVAANVTLRIEQISTQSNQLVARFLIENHSTETLRAISDDNQSINLSWRFVALGTTPGSYDNWLTRLRIASDIPPGRNLFMDVPVGMPNAWGNFKLEATMLQEEVIWFQDAGMPVARSDQNIELKAHSALIITR